MLLPALRDPFQPALRSPIEAASGFLVGSLFAAGEQGAWYDPADLSTMYQDSAGTTAGVVGQPVGMILDKRLGAVRGAELVVNGDFSAGTAGWGSINSPTFTVSAGQATIQNSAASQSGISQAILTAGKWYEVTLTRVAATGDSGRVSIGGTSASLAAGGNRFIVLAATATFVVGPNSATLGNSVTVDDISIKEIPGNHATQATAASRPTLRQDASGFYYLEFDGVDDSLATASVDFSATDKMTVFAGLHKASDAAIGALVELTVNSTTTAGSFGLFAPPTAAAASYNYRSGGSAPGQGITTAGFAAPVSSVVTGISDISGDSVNMRVNGVAGAAVTFDQGAGNYANAPLYIGRRGGSTLPFNGRLYSLIVRGAASDAALLARAERFVGSRMGIAL